MATKSCVGGIFFILFIILFSTSFQVLLPTEKGLLFNSWAGVFDDFCPETACQDGVWSSGRHFVGFWRSFKTYNTVLEAIEFSRRERAEQSIIQAFTKTGNTIQIACTIYYRLQPDKLRDLYDNFQNNYRDTYAKQLVAAIKNRASAFDNQDYFAKREVIKEAFKSVAIATLKPIFADVEYLMLREMEFPENIDAALIEKVTKQEAINTQTYLQQRNLLQSDVKVIRAQGQQNITQILAKSVAFANSHYKTAVANLSELVLKKEATVYATLKGATGLSLDSVQLNYYRWIKAYGRWASSLVFFGHNSKSALVNIPSLDEFDLTSSFGVQKQMSEMQMSTQEVDSRATNSSNSSNGTNASEDEKTGSEAAAGQSTMPCLHIIALCICFAFAHLLSL